MANLDEFVIEVKLKTDKLSNQLENLSKKIESTAGEADNAFAKAFEQTNKNLNKAFEQTNKNLQNAFKKTNENFKKAFDNQQIKKQMDMNESIIGGAVMRIGRMFTGGLAGFGILLGAKLALDFAKGFTSQGHNLQFMSGALNTTPQNLQLLQNLYQRAGSGKDEANSVISSLYSRLTSGQLDQSLSASLGILGIDVQRAQRDPTSVILEALKKIGNAGFSQAQRGQLVQGLGLGGAGSYFANKPQDFSKFLDEAKQSLISNDDVNKLADMDRKFQDIGARWTKIQEVILQKIYPALNKITDLTEQVFGIKNTNTNNKKIDAIYNRAPLLGTGYNANPEKEKEAQVLRNTVTKFGIDVWNKLKTWVSNAETSGGLQKQIAKADAMGAYGTSGLRLNTGKYVLNRILHDPEGAKTLTPEKLRANNYALANHLAEIYLADRINKYGVVGGLERYYGSSNPQANMDYANKVLQGGFNYQSKTPQNQGAIHNHQQVSYNVGNLNMTDVHDVRAFSQELTALSQTAYNSSRNMLT